MLDLKKLLLPALLFCTSCNVYAGGPLNVDGTTPVRYSTATVTLNFDIGMLGTRTNAQADSLVKQAMSIWNNVATADISLTQGNNLSVDVDGTNYTTYIPGSPTSPANSDGLNPVIYDNDGSIIDDLFGIGQSNNIAGFAASTYIPGTGTYKEGYMVLNGTMALSDSDLVGTITHELGHLIGLDHSQLNIDNTETVSTACTTATSLNDYPEMYPILCRVTNTLHEDDISAVSYLYPVSNISSTLGQISGVFVDTKGNPILGANIWVTDASTGNTYSVVSDYLKQNTGYFSMYVLPGSYTLNADAINPIFYGASSVGPYATTQTDPSFTSPNPISAVTYDGSTPGAPQTISVNAGENKYVKFVVDGSGQTSSKTMTILPKLSSGSSGSGATSPLFLVLAVGILYLRRKQVHA